MFVCSWGLKFCTPHSADTHCAQVRLERAQMGLSRSRGRAIKDGSVDCEASSHQEVDRLYWNIAHTVEGLITATQPPYEFQGFLIIVFKSRLEHGD